MSVCVFMCCVCERESEFMRMWWRPLFSGKWKNSIWYEHHYLLCCGYEKMRVVCLLVCVKEYVCVVCVRVCKIVLFMKKWVCVWERERERERERTCVCLSMLYRNICEKVRVCVFMCVCLCVCVYVCECVWNRERKRER